VFSVVSDVFRSNPQQGVQTFCHALYPALVVQFGNGYSDTARTTGF